MAYLVGLCVSLVLTATVVSAKYDIFDFNITTKDFTDLRDSAEEDLCAYVRLNCSTNANTNTTRPESLTKDLVIQKIVDTLASVEKHFNHTEDYGFERFNSTNGRKVLGLFLNSPRTKELLVKRTETKCFRSISENFVNITHQNNITQDFKNFITSSPFDDKHCITALRFNNFLKSYPENITGCSNETLSIVADVFEDVRVHLNNCTLPKVPDTPVAKSSGMILGSIHAILLSLILVKIY